MRLDLLAGEQLVEMPNQIPIDEGEAFEETVGTELVPDGQAHDQVVRGKLNGRCAFSGHFT